MQKQRLQIMADESMMFRINEVIAEENCKNETQAIQLIIARYCNYSRIIKQLENETIKWEEKVKNLEYEIRQKDKVVTNEQMG